jgi:hypothetical protein
MDRYIARLARQRFLRRMRLRACCASRAEDTYSAFGGSLFLAQEKVTKRTCPGVCVAFGDALRFSPATVPPTGHPWPDDGSFGILPRPARTRARAAMLGANYGAKIKGQVKS